MKKINILMAANSNYLKAACTVLQSLKSNCSQDFTLFFAGSIKEKERIKLRSIAPRIVFLDDAMNDVLNSLPTANRPRWITIESMVRVFAPFFMDCERALWLDCDTIVKKDISDLFTISMDNKSIGVDTSQKQRTICGKIIEHPFNAGILLMDVAMIKSKYTIEEIIDLLISIENNIVNYDEDLLNLLFEKDKHPIGRMYNSPVVNRLLDRKVNYDEASILHYWGRIKPWQIGYFSFINDKHFWKYGKKVFGYFYYLLLKISNITIYPFYIMRRLILHKGAD